MLALPSINSCSDNTVFCSYQGVESDGWDKTAHVVFNVSEMKSSGTYNETIGVRINSRYPFLTLNLIAEQRILPSNTVITDTIDCQLISDSGKRLGKGSSLWTKEFELRSISLNEGDSLAVSIRHNMRRDILRGVSDIGFKLEQTK